MMGGGIISEAGESMGKMAGKMTEKLIAGAVKWNKSLDFLASTSQLLTNPCHLLLLALGMTLPNKIYNTIAESLDIYFIANEEVEEKEKKVENKIVEMIQERDAAIETKKIANVEYTKCKDLKKQKKLPTPEARKELENELNELKKENSTVDNSLLLLLTMKPGNSYKEISWRLNAIKHKKKELELIERKTTITKERLRKVKDTNNISCSLLESTARESLGEKYLICAEYDLPLNNHIRDHIWCIVYCLVYKSCELTPLKNSGWQLKILHEGGQWSDKIKRERGDLKYMLGGNSSTWILFTDVMKKIEDEYFDPSKGNWSNALACYKDMDRQQYDDETKDNCTT